MPEFRTLPELEADLLAYGQAYAFGDIDKQEYDRAAANLNAQITARKLAIAKQGKGREMDQLWRRGGVTLKQHREALELIRNAKNEAELNAIQLQNLAA